MTEKRERKKRLATSARQSAVILKKARARTELELAKRSIDLTTGGPRATMVAAVAVAAVLPLADASNVLDRLTDATTVSPPEGDGATVQVAPCKKRCGGG